MIKLTATRSNTCPVIFTRTNYFIPVQCDDCVCPWLREGAYIYNSWCLINNKVRYIQWLTVQLYLMQSSQKRLAENFFFTTTVRPWIKHWPTPIILPNKRCNTIYHKHHQYHFIILSFFFFTSFHRMHCTLVLSLSSHESSSIWLVHVLSSVLVSHLLYYDRLETVRIIFVQAVAIVKFYFQSVHSSELLLLLVLFSLLKS